MKAESGFIKYMRSEEAEHLLSYPNANHLFMVMAYRARRTDHPMNGLKAGQCFLGDYSVIGLTERQYRTAKKQLKDWGLATFKGTNKGTVGTILNTKVYDINEEESDGQNVMQETDKGRTSDGQATTNKECKKERKKECNKRIDVKKLDYSSWPASDLTEEVFDDWVELRKKHRAPITQNVIERLGKALSECVAAGFTVNDCLGEAIERGWRTVKLEWMLNSKRVPRQSQLSQFENKTRMYLERK